VRIASLLPAATEIVAALGHQDDLVAVTYECDATAREHAAVVVDTALPQGLEPGMIDAVVRDRAARGLPMYELDRAALAGLDPDLIITQDLCRVCALPAGTVSDALDAIGCTADVLSVDPRSVDDVLAAIIEIGERIGAAAEAHDLVGGLRHRLAAVDEAVAGRPRPRVLVLEWTDPPFLAGHWVPELVRRAGGDPVGGTEGGRSVAADWADVIVLPAEVVLVAPCGFGLDAARGEAATVRSWFPAADVLAVDSDAYVVRPGPRLVDGIEAIAWALHPDAVAPPPPGRIARVRSA
jgi:iron complex transport system substrate-binding protein